MRRRMPRFVCKRAHHGTALNTPQLDQVTTNSEHPELTPLLAQLTLGRGKVSAATVREFVQGLNIGLDRGLSPGTHTFWVHTCNGVLPPVTLV